MIDFTPSALSFFQSLDNSDKIIFLENAFNSNQLEPCIKAITEQYIRDIRHILGDDANLHVFIETFNVENVYTGIITIENYSTKDVFYGITSNKLISIKDFLLQKFESGYILVSDTGTEKILKKYKPNMKFFNKKYVKWFKQLNEGFNYLCYN